MPQEYGRISVELLAGLRSVYLVKYNVFKDNSLNRKRKGGRVYDR